MWWILWLCLIVGFVLFEVITPQLTTIWFAIGALAALIVSLFAPDLLWVQALVFVVISIIAVLITRPLAKKYLSGKRTVTYADRCLGQEGIVTIEINNLIGEGQVNSKGTVWTARSTADGIIIPVGTTVIIERLEGVKAIVSVKNDNS